MSAILNRAKGFFASSIGKKIIVALTGLALLGFLAAHLVGNLLIFVGPDAINDYGYKLKSLGPLLWVMRIGLLVAFVVHIVATIQLSIQNKAARKARYAHEATVQASKASRIMIISGLIILTFVIYHLLHFTFGLNNDYHTYVDQNYLAKTGDERLDIFRMVVEGFSWWPAALFYIFAIGLLSFHLAHGFASVFQTLGLRTERSWPVIKGAGFAYALFIFVGNVSIPLSILTGIVK